MGGGGGGWGVSKIAIQTTTTFEFVHQISKTTLEIDVNRVMLH